MKTGQTAMARVPGSTRILLLSLLALAACTEQPVEIVPLAGDPLFGSVSGGRADVSAAAVGSAVATYVVDNRLDHVELERRAAPAAFTTGDNRE